MSTLGGGGSGDSVMCRATSVQHPQCPLGQGAFRCQSSFGLVRSLFAHGKLPVSRSTGQKRLFLSAPPPQQGNSLRELQEPPGAAPSALPVQGSTSTSSSFLDVSDFPLAGCRRPRTTRRVLTDPGSSAATQPTPLACSRLEQKLFNSLQPSPVCRLGTPGQPHGRACGLVCGTEGAGPFPRPARGHL